MAEDNVLHYQQIAQCEEQMCDRMSGGFIANRNENISKANTQAKILDYYQPKFIAGESVSQSSISSVNPVNSKASNFAQAILDDVCKELDNIDIIITKPHNRVVECLKQLNGNTSSVCSKNVLTSKSGQGVITSTDHSDIVVSSDLNAMQRKKLSTFRDALDPLLTVGLEHTDALMLSTNETCLLSTSAVQNQNINGEQIEHSVDPNSNVEVPTSNGTILSSSSFNVTDSAEALENAVNLPQMHCISIDVVTEEAENPSEQPNYLEDVNPVHKKNVVGSVRKKNEPTKKNTISQGLYKCMENRNTKARRISAKLKVKWTKELQATGHLMCPMEGCYQTYVTVANFQTHYKWCTGKKNLQHCPYCESLIFSGHQAVLHHMEVEHPEKVNEYKEKCVIKDTSHIRNVQPASNPPISSKPFVKRISRKYYRMKNHKNRDIYFSSKENFLSQKKTSLKHGLKSIEVTMNQNYKEFKKCVRFNDIVQKINSVSEEPVPSDINARKINTKPIKQKKGLFVEDNSEVLETQCFSDENDSVDCPSHVDDKVQKPAKRVTTKSRIVLNTQGYERFNQYLKLTRDWASERRTYSRSRSADSSINTSQNETSLPSDVQDTYQLSESLEPSGISLSVSEPEPFNTSEVISAFNCIKKPDKMSPTKNQMKFKKIVNEIHHLDSSFENELFLRNVKVGGTENDIKNAKFPSIQNSVKTDLCELNYGHIVFSKPNKVANRERTTCYDNAGNLDETLSSHSHAKRETSCQQNSKNTENSVCLPPAIDFDTLLESSVSVSKEKPSEKKRIPHTNSTLESGTKSYVPPVYMLNPMDDIRKGKESKYRKQDGVKLPKSSATESRIQKRGQHAKKEDILREINPIVYNEALKVCFNEEVNDFNNTKIRSRNNLQIGKKIKGKRSFLFDRPAGRKRLLPPLTTLAFDIVNMCLSRTTHMRKNHYSEIATTTFASRVNGACNYSNIYSSAVLNCSDITCKLILQNLVDRVSHMFNDSPVHTHDCNIEEKNPLCISYEKKSYSQSKNISTLSSTLTDYILSLGPKSGTSIVSEIISNFRSYRVKTTSSFSPQKKKRGRPPKQFLELKNLVLESSCASHILNNRNIHQRGRLKGGGLPLKAVSSSHEYAAVACESDIEKVVQDLISGVVSLHAENAFSCILSRGKRRRKGQKRKIKDSAFSSSEKIVIETNPNVGMCNSLSQVTNKTEPCEKQNSSALFVTAPIVVEKRKRGRPRKKVAIVSTENLSATNIPTKMTTHAIPPEDTVSAISFTTNSFTGNRSESEVLDLMEVQSNLPNKGKNIKEKEANSTPTEAGKKMEPVVNCLALSSDIHDSNTKQIPQAIRKSTRLRKRKIDPDAIFIQPKKIAKSLSSNNFQLDTAGKKTGKKRGRPRKTNTNCNPLNCQQQLESSNSAVLSSDLSHSVALPTNTTVKPSRSNINLSSALQVQSRKCSRKGRPRKCVRYEDLNSGIERESPGRENSEDLAALSKSHSSKEIEKSNEISTPPMIELVGKSKNSLELDSGSCAVPPEVIADDLNKAFDVNSGSPDINSENSYVLNKNIFKIRAEVERSELCESVKHKITSENCGKINSTEALNDKSKAKNSHENESTKVIKAKALCKQKSVFHRPSSNTTKCLDSSPVCAGQKHLKRTRLAAIRARKLFGQLNRRLPVQDLPDDFTSDADFIPSSKSFCQQKEDVEKELAQYKQYFVAPVAEPRTASAVQISLWVKELECNGKIVCERVECGKILETKAGMIYHYEHACLRAQQKWHCKICKKAMKPSHEVMLIHFKKKHSSILKSHESAVNFETKPKKSTVIFGGLNCTNALPLNHQFTELLPEFKPKRSAYEIISDCTSVFKDHMHFSKSSINVKLCSLNLHDDSTLWFSLAPFKSYPKNIGSSQATFFTGGTVSASSWCPTPHGKKARQYIIIATTTPSNTEKYHHAFSTEERDRSLLQLYDFGDLHDKVVTVQPTLKLAVVLNYGKIWSISWCPSGCWEDPSKNCDESDWLPRLGVVAVACTDSVVRLYTFPHPESLNCPPGQIPFYNVEPVAILKPSFGEPSLACKKALCTALSWQRTDKCELIAGGYSNGLVSLWQVTTSSALLVEKLGFQVVISPYLTFQAHTAAVTCVDFAPLSGGQYFASGSNDKTCKIWNLFEPYVPFLELRKGMVKSVVWPSIGTGTFICFEEGLNTKSTLCYQDLNSLKKKRSLSVHNACGQSFSVSELLSMAALGDSAGEVTASVLRRFLNMEHSKSSTFHQYPIFWTEVKSITKMEAEKTNSLNFSSVQNAYPETDNKLPCDSEYGLVFYDVPFNDLGRVPVKEKQRVENVCSFSGSMSSTVFGGHHPASINIVSWNPNEGSHHWLFTANHSGIARILCVSGFERLRT